MPGTACVSTDGTDYHTRIGMTRALSHQSKEHALAIGQVAVYAHLNEADVEALGRELDTIRANIEESLGSKDAAYIRRTITFQRTLDVAARLGCGCGRGGQGGAFWAQGPP